MALPVTAIRPLPDPAVPAAPMAAAPDKLLAGSGAQTLANVFSDPSGQFHVGLWSAEPGVLAVAYTESELCVILEGTVILRDQAGATVTFGPGEAFVIPSGFIGTWETVTPCRKIYAIFEPAA